MKAQFPQTEDNISREHNTFIPSDGDEDYNILIE